MRRTVQWGALAGSVAASVAGLAGCSIRHAPDDATPAERSHFLRSATYDEAISLLDLVGRRVHLLDSLGRRDSLLVPRPLMDLRAIDTSGEGRSIPVVVLAHPMVSNGAQAHASGRPVVYVEASMAAGEVDGKDAMLALVRDLVLRGAPDAPNVLDSVVVVVVPVTNPDGDAARGVVAVNRPNQRGPDSVGIDKNARGLTLNRDFVKTEAPETLNTLDLLHLWDPDTYVELHTADGSYSGFAYTYAPALHPASVFTGPYTHDSILPELERRLRNHYGLETFDYGTFAPPRGPGPDTVTGRRWQTFDYRARYGTNYVGLRDRIAILGVSYAHDPFERRVAAQEAFVREILSIVAAHGPAIRSVIAAADSSVRDWGSHPDHAPALPIAAKVAPGGSQKSILAEDLVVTGDSTLTEPGVPRGVRRTGHMTSLDLPVWNRFDGTRTARLPRAWLLPPRDSTLARRLALHGIESVRLAAPRRAQVMEYFVPDSIVHDPVAFEGHRLEHVYGRWHRVARDMAIGPGSYVVNAAQPLGILALQLLDPESADGFVTWNVFDDEPLFRPGGRFPIERLIR